MDLVECVAVVGKEGMMMSSYEIGLESSRLCIRYCIPWQVSRLVMLTKYLECEECSRLVKREMDHEPRAKEVPKRDDNRWLQDLCEVEYLAHLLLLEKEKAQ